LWWGWAGRGVWGGLVGFCVGGGWVFFFCGVFFPSPTQRSFLAFLFLLSCFPSGSFFRIVGVVIFFQTIILLFFDRTRVFFPDLRTACPFVFFFYRRFFFPAPPTPPPRPLPFYFGDRTSPHLPPTFPLYLPRFSFGVSFYGLTARPPPFCSDPTRMTVVFDPMVLFTLLIEPPKRWLTPRTPPPRFFSMGSDPFFMFQPPIGFFFFRFVLCSIVFFFFSAE